MKDMLATFENKVHVNRLILYIILFFKINVFVLFFKLWLYFETSG